MSFPNIPDVTASVSLTQEDSVNLLLSSIAFEELGLAHLINAEAEKIQYVLGTIPGQLPLDPAPTLEELLAVNTSVNATLRDIIAKEVVLLLQLETANSLTTTTTTTSTTTTSTTTTASPVLVGAAWTAGTPFGGEGGAEYVVMPLDVQSLTVNMVLLTDDTVMGTMVATRSGNNLVVTISANSPYLMSDVALYVDDTPPTDDDPTSYPNQYSVADPADYFQSHSFTVDISALDEPLYIAAYAAVYEQV